MSPNHLLKKAINGFIKSPFPLWETSLTDQLVTAAYEELRTWNINDHFAYTTEAALLRKESKNDKQYLVSYDRKSVYLETPNTATLNGFYAEHGLVPLNLRELVENQAATKLKSALNILAEIPECIDCIASLVNCIQVVASEGPDYDTSYSHPDLPFTLFVSVCENDSMTSNIRVAEGILHEAMHLKLSLIQEHVRLIQRGNTETYYSPWRQEQRPLNGVLHGIFVFRAVYDFLQLLKGNYQLTNGIASHLSDRIADIAAEFGALRNFGHCNGLTKYGASLSANLLPLN